MTGVTGSWGFRAPVVHLGCGGHSTLHDFNVFQRAQNAHVLVGRPRYLGVRLSCGLSRSSVWVGRSLELDTGGSAIPRGASSAVSLRWWRRRRRRARAPVHNEIEGLWHGGVKQNAHAAPHPQTHTGHTGTKDPQRQHARHTSTPSHHQHGSSRVHCFLGRLGRPAYGHPISPPDTLGSRLDRFGFARVGVCSQVAAALAEA